MTVDRIELHVRTSGPNGTQLIAHVIVGSEDAPAAGGDQLFEQLINRAPRRMKSAAAPLAQRKRRRRLRRRGREMANGQPLPGRNVHHAGITWVSRHGGSPRVSSWSAVRSERDWIAEAPESPGISCRGATGI